MKDTITGRVTRRDADGEPSIVLYELADDLWVSVYADGRLRVSTEHHHLRPGNAFYNSGAGMSLYLIPGPDRGESHPAPAHMPDHLRTDDLPAYLTQKGEGR